MPSYNKHKNADMDLNHDTSDGAYLTFFTILYISVGKSEHGPNAQLIIQEKCAEGAKFCFNSNYVTLIYFPLLALQIFAVLI